MYGELDYSPRSDGQNADFGLFKLMKPTNLDIKDATYLHVFHILQHATSRPTTRSTPDINLNAPKTNLSSHPAATHSKRPSNSHNNVIKRIMARVACRLKESER
jgi:hypothetical protein